MNKIRHTGFAAPKDRYCTPVLFNPYTGEPRDVRDVQSDPQGLLIVPIGALQLAASPEAPAAAVVQVPPGYKLVPVEPTPEMRAAYHAATHWDAVIKGEAGARWAAMLAAAPQQPAPQPLTGKEYAPPKDMDISQRVGYRRGWVDALRAHGIGEQP